MISLTSAGMSSLVKGAGGCPPLLLSSLSLLSPTLLGPALPLLPALLRLVPPALLPAVLLPSQLFLASVLLPDPLLASSDLGTLSDRPSLLAELPSVAELLWAWSSRSDTVRFLLLRVKRGMVERLR